MSRATYFKDFVRDDGAAVTVEYRYSPGSETTYSPHSGACGGDGCEVEIVANWPNTQEYNDLHSRRQELTLNNYGRELGPITISMMDPDLREELAEIDKSIEQFDENCRLTDAEIGRMTEWLMEHHVYEPYDDVEF